MSDKRSTPSSSPLLLKYLRAYEQNRRSRVFAPLAETYRKLGMLDKALEVCREGIKHNPGYVLGHLALAGCYYDMGQASLTYETLRPFVAGNRDNVTLQRLYARSARDTGEHLEALDTFKYLLFVNPRDKEAADEVAKLENRVLKSQAPGVQAPAPTKAVERFAVETMELFSNSAQDAGADDWALLNLQKMAPSPTPKPDPLEDWNVARTQALKEDLAPIQDKLTDEERTFIVDFRDARQQEHEKPFLEESPSSTSGPLITHTLVDLYCAQGLNDKAVDILEKLLELDPKDTRTMNRLQELRQVMAGTSRSDEGRSELMGLFDKTVKDNEGPRRERFLKFLGMIRRRSQDFRGPGEDLS